MDEHLVRRCVTVLLMLLTAVAVVMALVLPTQADCIEEHLGDACFYLTQLEHATQNAPAPASSPQDGLTPAFLLGERASVWPSQETTRRREAEQHAQQDHWNPRRDGAPTPVSPWCERKETR
jgi:hypothetical protein